jgi:hypothetical protein
MPTVPEVWLTPVIVQLAAPLAFVVPEQVWSALPEPKVNVTVWPPTSVPGDGSVVVKTPDRVADQRWVTEVVPVEHLMLGSDAPFPLGEPNPVTFVRSALPADQGAPFIDYASVHNMLYSSNFAGGLWRVVLP